MKKLLAAAAVVFFAASPVHAGDDCKRIVIVTSLEMLPSPGARVVVPASVDGKELRMVVDTGGYLTALSEEKAQELGLQISVSPASRIVLLGGHAMKRFATLSNFSLGRLKAGRLEYPLLPPNFLEPGSDGLLGADFLANFDLDFDFAGGKLNLVSKDHCDGKVGYWTSLPLIGIPIVREADGVHISTYVKVDGHEVKALIDTGAPFTLLSLDFVQSALGIRDDDPKLEALPGGPNKMAGARKYPIKQISFGDVAVNNPNVVLVPEQQMHMGPNAPKMILGLSVLRQLHLYIAYREKMLYVTPVGEHR